MIPLKNNFFTDSFLGYDWANDLNSGYRRFIHIHGRNDFSYGQDWNSHIESVWLQIKKQNMITYKMISSNNLLFFIKEAEFKLKNKFLSYENK